MASRRKAPAPWMASYCASLAPVLWKPKSVKRGGAWQATQLPTPMASAVRRQPQLGRHRGGAREDGRVRAAEGSPQRARAVVFADHLADVSQRLRSLAGQPAEVAAENRLAHEILGARELAIVVQQEIGSWQR